MPTRAAQVTFAELNLSLGSTPVYNEAPTGGSVASGSCTDSASGPRRARVTHVALTYPSRDTITYTETLTGGSVAGGNCVDTAGGPRHARVTWAWLSYTAREQISYDEHPGFPFGYPPYDWIQGAHITITMADTYRVRIRGAYDPGTPAAETRDFQPGRPRRVRA